MNNLKFRDSYNGIVAINTAQVKTLNLPSDFNYPYASIVQFANLYASIGKFQLLSGANNSLYFRAVSGNTEWLPWKKII